MIASAQKWSPLLCVQAIMADVLPIMVAIWLVRTHSAASFQLVPSEAGLHELSMWFVQNQQFAL